MIAVAVYCSFARYGEAIKSIGVNQGREILACLSLNTSHEDGEVGDVFASLQLSVLLDIEMCSLTEEECTAHECALRNDNHSPAFIGSTVDNSLNGLGLHNGAVFLHSVVSNDISLAKSGDIHFAYILKPWRH